MKADLTGAEVLGYVESREENDQKVDVLKQQIKAINADSTELTKISAKDFEVKSKDLNSVYKRYKEIKAEGNEDSSYYELLSLLEEELDAAAPTRPDEDDEDDLSA
jgi:hypothetical protein